MASLCTTINPAWGWKESFSSTHGLTEVQGVWLSKSHSASEEVFIVE